MSEQTEATFAIPVAWMRQGTYQVKAKNLKQALSKVVLRDDLPEEVNDEMDTFQFKMAKLPKVNDLVQPDDIEEIQEETKKVGWKGFANHYIDG